MKNKYIKAALFITIAILLVVAYSFVGDVRRLHRSGVLNFSHIFHHMRQNNPPK